MEESVPRPIAKHDEAKALICVVPLDCGLDSWARGIVELRTPRRRISEIT
jgi:hypothetical protein